MVHHLSRHLWFYVSALLGVALWAALERLDGPLRLALAGDLFFALYLLSAAIRGAGASPATIRRKAASSDEGMAVIILINLGALALSLAAIFGLVNAAHTPGPAMLLLSLASVPLGWVTLHTVMAWHYAHTWYAPGPDGSGDAGGLDFPGTAEPSLWDFLYYSFVVGMTAQVSDVSVSGQRLRRLTLGHGIVSFFFNAVIVALAVNVAISLAG